MKGCLGAWGRGGSPPSIWCEFYVPEAYLYLSYGSLWCLGRIVLQQPKPLCICPTPASPALDLSVLQLCSTCLSYSSLCCLRRCLSYSSCASLEVSLLQQLVILWTCLSYSSLSYLWTCLSCSIPLLPVDVSVLQLFMFNSCCRTDIPGEDLSRNSRGFCKETRTGAAQAALEQT